MTMLCPLVRTLTLHLHLHLHVQLPLLPVHTYIHNYTYTYTYTYSHTTLTSTLTLTSLLTFTLAFHPYVYTYNYNYPYCTHSLTNTQKTNTTETPNAWVHAHWAVHSRAEGCNIGASTAGFLDGRNLTCGGHNSDTPSLWVSVTREKAVSDRVQHPRRYWPIRNMSSLLGYLAPALQKYTKTADGNYCLKLCESSLGTRSSKTSQSKDMLTQMLPAEADRMLKPIALAQEPLKAELTNDMLG